MLLSYIGSRGLDVLNVMDCTNLNITAISHGVVRLMIKLIF